MKLQIKTASDLRLHVLKIITKEIPLDLDEYLLSLLSIFIKNKSREPTYSAFAIFLNSAFTEKPAKFDPNWSQLKSVSNPINTPEFYEEVKTYVHCETILKLLITEIKKMKEKNLFHKDDRYFGIDLGTGAKWYHFTVVGYLEAGTAHLENYDKNDEEFNHCSWQVISSILTEGKTHE